MSSLQHLLSPLIPTEHLAGDPRRTAPRYRSVGEMLAAGVLKGQWTLEQFDGPSPTAAALCCPSDQHINPVREWIQNNPERWDAMLRIAMAQELDSPDSSHDEKTFPWQCTQLNGTDPCAGSPAQT
jgi:hypothetical protein